MQTMYKDSRASPATTNCSELEYLIALQSEELIGSQVRRSQRLREKNNATKTQAKIPTNTAITNTAGSPQLFVDTDEELSQLGQLPPQQTTKDATKKRCSQEAAKVEFPKAKTRRQSVRPRARKPTLSSKLKLKTMQLKPKLTTMNTPTVVIPPESNASVLEITTLPEQQPQVLPKLSTEHYYQNQAIVSSTKVVPLTSMLTETNIKIFQQTKRGRSKEQSEAVQMPKAVQTGSNLPIFPQVNSSTGLQYDYSAVSKPIPIASYDTETYGYQRSNLTQTLLPDRYPAHFIHQLPPACNSLNENYTPAVPIVPAVKLRQICPTPDTTPTAGHELLSPSPPNVDSLNSTTPSLSDSLAEIFGTRKIRNILNIEPPRKYLVQELHLPVIAFMLNVELERLRVVLGMTQSLTLEQMQQMMHESGKAISIHASSSSDNADD